MIKMMNRMMKACQKGTKQVLFVLGMMCALSSHAQTTTETVRWYGVDYTSFTTGTTNPTRFYLYNVGTGTFMAAGGEWGTQAVLKYKLFGNGCTLEKTGSNYLINSQMQNQQNTLGKYFGTNYPQVTTNGQWNNHQGNTMGVILEAQSSNTTNKNPANYTRKMEFIRVETDADAHTYTYYIKETLSGKNSTKTVYLGAKKGINPSSGTDAQSITEPTEGENIVTMTEQQSVWSGNEDYQWRFITEKQLEGLTDDPADNVRNGLDANLTFLIKDPFFDRNHDYEYSDWKVNNTSSTSASNTYRWKWQGSDANISFAAYDNNYSTTGTTSTETPWDKAIATRVQFNGNEQGKYSFVLFEGKGTVYQTFTARETGWYWLSCNGVWQGHSAKLFLKAGNETKEIALKQAGSALTKVSNTNANSKPGANGSKLLDLGKLIYSDATYKVTTDRIWIEEGTEITIGVSKEEVTEMQGSYNTTGVLQKTTTYYKYDSDIVAIDAFDLQYSRDIFVFDEDCEDDSYITGADVNKEHVDVYLHRTFSIGKWNTLVLPIPMTKAQTQSTFGQDVQIAQLHGVSTVNVDNPYCIDFKSIKLSEKSDDDNVITAGTLYIIKPTAAGKYITTYLKDANDETSAVTATQCYSMGRRSFKGSDIPKPTSTVGTNADESKIGKVNYVGTYKLIAANADGGTVQGSYVLSGGEMYHLSSSIRMKGFRGWLNAVDANGNVDANAKLSFGFVSDGDATYIDGVTENHARAYNIYNIYGKLVRANATTTEGLPQGLYVVNGKKMIVK